MATSFEEIPEEECFKLLKSRDIGRLGVDIDGYPLIFPVNYAVDDRAIVIRTAGGAKFDATADANVSFEIDEVDHAHRTVWSVLVAGKAFHAELEGSSHPQPIAPGEKPSVIRIIAERVTGRRLDLSGNSLELDPRGYL